MKNYGILLLAVMLAILPMVLATDVGTGVGVTVTTEKFKPMVWACDHRVLVDDNIENGANGLSLQERKNNYAFEGESIQWNVLVMDKNKIEAVTDVVGTIGSSQGSGNDVEVECDRQTGNIGDGDRIPSSCNARIGEENITKFDSSTMAFYTCKLTVETPNSMHGKYFLTVEAKTADGQATTMDENEYWFLNPEIALSVDGDLTFDNVRPGTTAYSQTMLVGNDAEAGSGVLLDMYISGTDFYDPSSSGAFCSDGTNKLALTAFRYYATNGAFSTAAGAGADSEGYLGIAYGNKVTQANKIILGTNYGAGASDTDIMNGNALAPGAQLPITFKLNMPEPCTGDFSDGQIFFWGEAI